MYIPGYPVSRCIGADIQIAAFIGRFSQHCHRHFGSYLRTLFMPLFIRLQGYKKWQAVGQSSKLDNLGVEW